MTQIARTARVGRRAVYKSVGECGNPILTAMSGVIKSPGLSLRVRVRV